MDGLAEHPPADRNRQKVLADGTRDAAARRHYEFNDPPHS